MFQLFIINILFVFKYSNFYYDHSSIQKFIVLELYYGGEALTVENPQAFTCPYCGKMGFTEVTLLEHVNSAEHAETSPIEVVSIYLTFFLLFINQI